MSEPTMYEKWAEVLEMPQTAHVIVLKRYDDNGGAWGIHASNYPDKFYYRDCVMEFHTLGLISTGSRDSLVADLEAHGFVLRQYTECNEGFQKALIAQGVPLEWKEQMAEFGSRIVIYTRHDGAIRPPS